MWQSRPDGLGSKDSVLPLSLPTGKRLRCGSRCTGDICQPDPLSRLRPIRSDSNEPTPTTNDTMQEQPGSAPGPWLHIFILRRETDQFERILANRASRTTQSSHPGGCSVDCLRQLNRILYVLSPPLIGIGWRLSSELLEATITYWCQPGCVRIHLD